MTFPLNGTAKVRLKSNAFCAFSAAPGATSTPLLAWALLRSRAEREPEESADSEPSLSSPWGHLQKVGAADR